MTILAREYTADELAVVREYPHAFTLERIPRLLATIEARDREIAALRAQVAELKLDLKVWDQTLSATNRALDAAHVSVATLSRQVAERDALLVEYAEASEFCYAVHMTRHPESVLTEAGEREYRADEAIRAFVSAQRERAQKGGW